MELTPRKREILAAIIKTYIRTGEPVGSKALVATLDTGLSSATLRNEMSELSELGYLEQPHTSAGRIPTSAGYRLYVTQLMRRSGLSGKAKQDIDGILKGLSNDPEQMVDMAAEALSDFIGLPALSATLSNEDAYVRRAELLPMGKRSALMVVITSDGVSRTRICRTEQELTPELLSRFDRLAAVRVVGTELSQFHPAFLQTLAAEAGDCAFAMLPLLSELFRMVGEICEAKLNVQGESHLLAFNELERHAKQLLELISRQDAILAILSGLHDPVCVVFGDDTSIDALRPSSIVMARYQKGQKDMGRIGIIGPVRMEYEQVIPNIEYFAAKLGALLTQSLKDMED